MRRTPYPWSGGQIAQATRLGNSAALRQINVRFFGQA